MSLVIKRTKVDVGVNVKMFGFWYVSCTSQGNMNMSLTCCGFNATLSPV